MGRPVFFIIGAILILAISIGIIFIFGLKLFPSKTSYKQTGFDTINAPASPFYSPSPTPQGVISSALPIEGTITEIGQSSTPETLFMKVLLNNGSAVNVQVDDNSKISSQDNRFVTMSDLNRGFVVEIKGATIDNIVHASEVRVVNSPNIVIFSPRPDENVGLKIRLNGIARVFESQFRVRLTNKRNSHVYVDTMLNSNAPDAGEYGEFTYEINLTNNLADLLPADTLRLEAFQLSARDDSEIDKVTISLKYQGG